MRLGLICGVIAMFLAGSGCSYGPDESADPPVEGATTVAPTPVVDPGPLLSDAVLALDDAGSRAAHTTTKLLDETLLVAGGCVIDGCGTATAETLLVAADGKSVIPGPTMSNPRDSHTATLIGDGRVVLVGGFAGEGEAPLRAIELFDPTSGLLIDGAPLVLGRGGHVAANIGDGRVLIAGGWVAPRTYTATTEIFDGLTGTITSGPDMPVAVDALDAVTLADGRVLVTGGQVQSGVGTSMAAIYDSRTNTWSETGPMLTARFKHMSVLLNDGSVLVIGGTTDDQTLLATTEIFDPAAGIFSQGPDLVEPRYKIQAGALVIEDGRVVIAGGGRTVEVLDVTTGRSVLVDSFRERGSFATISLLSSGDFLVLGGYDDRINLRRDVRIIASDDL